MSPEPPYAGQIGGENSRNADMPCNPTKRKELTNHRVANKSIDVGLAVPRKMTLDQALEWIGDEELVEVTPDAIRVRKSILDPHARKRALAQLAVTGPGNIAFRGHP